MEFIRFASQIAKEAGSIIRENFGLGMQREWKGDGSPVTETDEKINQLVIDAVAKFFPDHSVLGEEGSSTVDLKEFTWVCDPVDGTIPFSHGIPTNVFSLALCKNGEPFVGVIYDPYMNRMCLAEKGKGATLNGKPIQVNSNSGFRPSVIGADGPPHGLVGVNDIFKELTEKGSHVLTLRSICYSGMLVSLGEFSAAITTGTTPWDGAALAVLVTEAGGKITDLYGSPQRYDRDINGFLVSNGLIHDEIIETLSRLLPKF